MNRIKLFEAFINETDDLDKDFYTPTDMEEFKKFLVDEVGVKADLIDNCIMKTTKGHSREIGLMAMWLNNKSTPEGKETIKKYIQEKIVPNFPELAYLKGEAVKESRNIPFALKENKAEAKVKVPTEIDGVAVQQVSFDEFHKAVSKKEGIVLLGTGGDIAEWVNGVTKVLNDESIAKGTAKELWSEIFVMTTTGGRTDTALVYTDKVNPGKLAIWRLKFGDCSWISDYLVNYKKDHHEE